MFSLDVFTKLRVCLNIPPVMLMSLDALDLRFALANHVSLDKFIETLNIHRFSPNLCVFTLDPDRKELEGLHVGFL
jgi:hypothetical protein